MGNGRKLTITYTDDQAYHGYWTLNGSCAQWIVANGGTANVVLDNYRAVNGVNMITSVTNADPAVVTTKENIISQTVKRYTFQMSSE